MPAEQRPAQRINQAMEKQFAALELTRGNEKNPVFSRFNVLHRVFIEFDISQSSMPKSDKFHSATVVDRAMRGDFGMRAGLDYDLTPSQADFMRPAMEFAKVFEHHTSSVLFRSSPQGHPLHAVQEDQRDALNPLELPRSQHAERYRSVGIGTIKELLDRQQALLNECHKAAKAGDQGRDAFTQALKEFTELQEETIECIDQAIESLNDVAQKPLAGSITAGVKKEAAELADGLKQYRLALSGTKEKKADVEYVANAHTGLVQWAKLAQKNENRDDAMRMFSSMPV
jgi:hypothetical protein